MPVQSSLQQVMLPSSSSTSQSLSQSQSQSPKKKNKNKINSDTNITITNVQQQQQQQRQQERQLLPLRTIEYRRRKHEWAKRYTSQQGLREAFGSNRNKFWGDLDAKTARRLYKKLLFPTALSELILELGDDVIRPEELSPLAYEARKAAKLYVRERCRVPSRVGAYLFDGIRQFRKHGKFQMDGVTYEQLWIRYYHDHDIDDPDDDGGFGSLLFAIDRFYLKKYNETKEQQGEYNNNSNSNISINDDDNDDNYKITIKDRIVRGGRTQQRWRRRRGRVDRYNDLLLERITNTLERDVRKLLLSYSSPSENEDDIVNHRLRDGEGIGIDNEYDKRNNINYNNSNNNKDNEMLSSRRMTQQEYHSLKLFAKARKYSQQQQKLSIDATKAHSEVIVVADPAVAVADADDAVFDLDVVVDVYNGMIKHDSFERAEKIVLSADNDFNLVTHAIGVPNTSGFLQFAVILASFVITKPSTLRFDIKKNNEPPTFWNVGIPGKTHMRMVGAQTCLLTALMNDS
ncbi:hypothetical protein FRACYDRAFT_243314 [Fragilariopsis cylindrus CCMP1102]|uniref:Uncharacterized protein n=1 Tax=Fragilariopsis cylindrus CCMP1102 TaxID=635003 RepID=A0A1E7F457_9STRA|nr:hypothetical protein FRACYDRAFT_243314 [Fragilariopsis cylindrus CCMP1102]|eukprot:OEU12978.1 hypothetical protein FRACYDRAFT_243314 [Fragilariopsis cylindrus CCMP1102]